MIYLVLVTSSFFRGVLVFFELLMGLLHVIHHPLSCCLVAVNRLLIDAIKLAFCVAMTDFSDAIQITLARKFALVLFIAARENSNVWPFAHGVIGRGIHLHQSFVIAVN